MGIILNTVSPTVFKYKGYRFFFFSREESRIHIHVSSSEGEAKFWLEPIVALAHSHGLSSKQLSELQKIIEGKENEIKKNWKKHFGS